MELNNELDSLKQISYAFKMHYLFKPPPIRVTVVIAF